MEKRVQDYSKEILKIIRSNTSPAVMGGRLQDYHENDLADVMPKLTVQERCKLYRIPTSTPTKLAFSERGSKRLKAQIGRAHV